MADDGALRERIEAVLWDGQPAEATGFKLTRWARLDAVVDSVMEAIGPLPFMPICDDCGDPLTAPGALMFSPPNSRGYVRKFHLCADCYGPENASLDTTPVSDGGECPHIVTSDDPLGELVRIVLAIQRHEAAKGIELLDAWKERQALIHPGLARHEEQDLLGWAWDKLRPILAAAAADHGAAE